MDFDVHEELWHFRKTAFHLDLRKYFEDFHGDQLYLKAMDCPLFDQPKQIFCFIRINLETYSEIA